MYDSEKQQFERLKAENGSHFCFKNVKNTSPIFKLLADLLTWLTD